MEAKDITMVEAEDILKRLLSKLSEKKIELGIPRTEEFHICYDHASVHNTLHKVIQSTSLKVKIWPQPPKSPDCNKPIEHVHGWIDADMHKWLRHTRCLNPNHKIHEDECKQKCIEFFEKIPASKIAADVETLPDTWQAIVDAGGDHIPAALS